MQRIRLGLIGCGGIAAFHTKRLQKLQDVEIAAAADTNQRSLAEFCQRFEVANAYVDYQELLQSGFVDAVLVCVPTHLHARIVCSAARAGKHVFCEKPLARRLQDGRDVVAVCQEQGVILMVGFVRRFDAYWGTAKEVVDNGLLGTPCVWQDIHSGSGPDHVPWFFEQDQGAGPLLDGMIHNIDFAGHMFGRAVEVQAGLTKFKSSSATDTGTVWVKYDSGNIMANFWSWGLPHGVSGINGTAILGPNGVLLFPSGHTEETKGSYDENTEGAFLLVGRDGKREPIVYTKNDMFLEEMRHFVTCVRENKTPLVTGNDGLEALAVALAILGEEQLT